jgi:glutamate-1-semialdehyde 2,1-aminomutase
VEYKLKVVAVIQARSSSTRLPNKVMKLISNKTMIELQLCRVSQSKEIDKIIVASTESVNDKALVDHINSIGYETFIGSEDDVLDRYFRAAQEFKADIVVRLTADCPLLDHSLIDNIIIQYKNSNFDYISNTLEPTFPDGLDIEVFSFDVLHDAWKNAKTSYDREHVTPYLKRSTLISKKNYSNLENLSLLRWTVDEQVDLDLVTSIFDHFSPNILFSWQDVLLLSTNQPEIFNINKNIIRDEGAKMSKGQKLYKRAKKIIPGGNMLLSKRPEMFLPEHWPAYFSKAKGCDVWDLDGKKYKDVSIMGIGTNILGYGHQEIDSAVSEIIKTGNMSTLNCPEEVYLAERLIQINPWADMVKFARSGGEANAIAIRIARAASQKDNIAICGYHGWHDWYLSSNLNTDGNNLDEHLLAGLSTKGVPSALKGTVYPFSYNNFEELIEIVETKNIGTIKMEVMRNHKPKDNFLLKVRELATKKNIVLIFDECTSGFRETFGGLHSKFNIEPDIAMYGKALGNGYAITAIVGTKEVMIEAQSSFISSTFWTERIGPAAALKTLEVMEKEESWIQITKIGKRVKKGWSDIAINNDLKLDYNGIPALASFNIVSVNNNTNLYKTLITQEMLKRGFLASNSFYSSTSHDDMTLDSYLNNLNDIFSIISSCEKGEKKIEELLDGPQAHLGFKRLN